MSQRRELGSGVVRFYSHEEVGKYLRDLCEYYQKESEKYGDKLGLMLRGGPEPSAKESKKEEKEKKPEPKKAAQGWVKMGSLLLNTTTPESASTEVMYQVHEELKLKLAKSTEALKSFEQNAATLVAQNSTFDIYVRNGVPERIVAKANEGKKASFNFDGRFRVV